MKFTLFKKMNRTLRFILFQTIYLKLFVFKMFLTVPLVYKTPAPVEKYTTLYIYILTFCSHAHGQTLLESTVLTPISVGFVDRTVFVSAARIPQLFPDASLEESLTPFTTCAAIMTT